MGILKTILSISFSLYFLFAGTGINIIDFCCECCESAGIELFVHQHCSPVSEQNGHLCKSAKDNSCESEKDHDCEKNCNGNEHHCTEQCKVTRLQVETPDFSKGHTCNCNSCDLKYLLFANDLFLSNQLSSDFNSQKIVFSPPKIHFTGRDVLICKAVLLI